MPPISPIAWRTKSFPRLRAGFVVLTDRYIFSLMARAIARGEDRAWIERVASFALVPHAIYYLRAEVRDLVPRVVLGRGAFDHWESGMDMRFGADMHDSFVKYQIARDSRAGPHGQALQLRGDRRDQDAGSDFPGAAAIDRQTVSNPASNPRSTSLNASGGTASV